MGVPLKKSHVTRSMSSTRAAPALDDVGGGETDYYKYRLQTRGEYEDLLTELEFRSRRMAVINNYEAAAYERKAYWTEIIAALLGAFSVTGLGIWLAQLQSTITSVVAFVQLGTLGIFGLMVAFVVQLISKGSERVLPSFSKRAESHIKAAAAWQRLAQRAKSFRIQLDNPKLDISTFAEWYEQLIEQKEKLSSTIIIAQSTFNLLDDPKKVFAEMKKQRQMFLQYLALEHMDAKDLHVKNA
ncbi:uncharacterized protein LOC106072044 isoform X1 [Biomphalaria glabrata]|uniref:Uncharacterized protein LOC106072044 isoform X1 n=3 Tax=Biomphalaria glabrata TaxID=6526 RepID=A0A9W3A7J5_BIOGL|nr:uncharacterized protein LOC106072044 isoform X1 [Biomphalaria glabrata]